MFHVKSPIHPQFPCKFDEIDYIIFIFTWLDNLCKVCTYGIDQKNLENGLKYD